jgi:serine/threonine protein kinase/Tol biopolymer transport system component
MGEVYRARDTKLKRDVAIKILPAAFAQDPDRIARLQREAEVLATLNHPNIAAVYGFEESAAATGIVLELIEGPTLADRIVHGALPLDEALAIARQIADALAAAHDKNIIHRDLKPANIKVTPGGNVKVLDFGLAKIAEIEPARQASLTMSPTLAVQATSAGLILGTAGYMSPEQARGKLVDRRSDIWSFGCVLYEMLTGRPVFDTGETVSDAVAAILTRDPDWKRLPAHVPDSIRRLLRRCLEKDPDRRLHHIADARLEIADAINAPAVASEQTVPQVPRSPIGMRLLPWAVAAAALGVAGFVVWASSGSRSSDAAPVRRLELTLPIGVELFSGTRSVSVSPDGSRVAYIGLNAGTRRVYVRALDQFEATAIQGSDSATACLFSPDGRSIAFVVNGGIIKTFSLSSGLVNPVTDGANFFYGATWGEDGQIVFVRSSALWQIPASGGTARQLTKLGGAQGDTLHMQPMYLPGGKTLLFVAVASGDRRRIDALVLATGERRTVVDDATLPLYARSGHIVFFRNGELLAAPFDADRLALIGSPVQAVEKLPAQLQGIPSMDISNSGTVAYAPTTAVSRLVSVSRQGAERPLNDVARNYANPRLSPDGTRLVVQAGDLWVQDLARSNFTRLASRDAVINAFPTWLPDGRRVIYRSPTGLRIQDTEGTGQAQILSGTSDYDYPASFASDETLIISRSTQKTSLDILSLSLLDSTNVNPLLMTTAYEGGPRLSPDGKWLAYVSDESGQNDVYLRPYPAVDRRWTVSTQGGTQPMWNADGKEIFYRNNDKMMVVELTTTPDVKLSTPRLLFEQRYAYGVGITIANYDVTPDGQSFIMVKDEVTGGRLNVIFNWFTELNRLAPGR